MQKLRLKITEVMKRSSFKELIQGKGGKVKYGSQRRIRTLYSCALMSGFLTSTQRFASAEETPRMMTSCSIEELPDVSMDKIDLSGGENEEGAKDHERDHVSFSPLSEDKVMQNCYGLSTGADGIWTNKEEMFNAFRSFNDGFSLTSQ